MHSLFRPPDEKVIESLQQRFPCRDSQIQTLSTLLNPHSAPCHNIVLYGTEATGKSSITEALLQSLSAPSTTDADDAPSRLDRAILNSVQCITPRHLLERTLSAVADALHWESRRRTCETVSQLAVELSHMLKGAQRPDDWRFVLVFDSIDRQREASAVLLPALARLSETIPCLTCVFILTSPPADFLRISAAPHIHFPNYSKADFVRIMSLTPPETLPTTTPEDTAFLWPRFCGAVHDALTSAASRTLPSGRHACVALWPRFTAPVLAATHGPREFSKLLIAGRAHFQDESLLNPGIISISRSSGSGTATPTPQAATSTTPASTSAPALVAKLPTMARLLLLAAYLASHNASKHDLTLFSTYHHGRRKRRGGGFAAPRQSGARGNKHRKISRKLLGAHAFALERMMAIFASMRSEWAAEKGLSAGAAGLDADVGMALSTLASLRLLVRVGVAPDPLDRGGKWRINVGWDFIRGVGRSMEIEVEEWLID
ncbi:origin recognition complex subunit Orc5 [Plectosphaerella cucumerina]|uniref:Origin recognition complex subunit Orc5 n=1 Tax=Plectosphaerella cucumerina TaxID=40658 RepID=A0A8K0X4F0_9PEZI|nr:origin recognition complex subunit Orc5 [Plectosphaerella cucumerina]